jgi:hypothetical protein
VQVAGVKRGESASSRPADPSSSRTATQLLLLGSPQALRRIETMLGPPGA